MSQRLSDSEFKDIYSRVPRLCVDLVIRTPSGVILSLRKLPSWNGLWHLPGGTILYKEPAEKTVHRIAKSELGADVSIKKVLGYIEFPSEEATRGYGWSVSIVFLCELESDKIKTSNHDSYEIRAFTEIPENIVPEHKEFLTRNWKEIF